MTEPPTAGFDPYRFPPHWEADVVVADGATVHLRPITPDDAEHVVAFHAGLSAETRYLRYFSVYPRISQRELTRFTHMDNVNRVALATWLGSAIIAIGRFDRIEATPVAEVAFVVADAHQGRGIGSVLLEHLAEAARELEIANFEAVVLAHNRKMIKVFLDAGYHPSRHAEGSEITLLFDIARTYQTDKVIAEREQRAEARSIQRLLRPRSVAVIGSNADELQLASSVVANLERGGFQGLIYPVSATSHYRSVSEVPAELDLVIVTAAADEVAGIVNACGVAGVHALVVISAGFGESGDESQRAEGVQRQRQLVATARLNGMRVLGPNCLGIINTDPLVSLNASLSTLDPLPGRAGVFCQSGALGMGVLGEATSRGLGISTFVSAGNRADVSGNDLLQYWESDPATEVALLYLESFGNPRKFARLARRFAKRKPIVAVKGGRGALVAGLQHTGVDVPESTIEALFQASGVIRTQNLTELFDVAVLLSTQPLPVGNRVCVVGHSSALALLIANALSDAGLSLARVVDVGVTASAKEFSDAVAHALADDDSDSVVAIFVPPMRRGQDDEVAGLIGQAVAAHQQGGGSTAVLSVLIGFDAIPAAIGPAGSSYPARGSVPSYAAPERAVTALGRVTRYAAWRRRDAGRVPQLSATQLELARDLVTEILAHDRQGRGLSGAEAAHLLGLYGIEVVPALAVTTPQQAVAAAEELGWPVALIHDRAVRLHLIDPDSVLRGWLSLGLATQAGAVVQPMMPRGVDTVLRLHDDQSFGSLISFGIGGVATDLLEDRAYAVIPLTSLDAAELISGPKAFPLLTGYAGSQPVDIPALVEIALRLSALADDLPEVVECVLDPLVASSDSAHVLAAQVTVAPVRRSAVGARRLGGGL